MELPDPSTFIAAGASAEVFRLGGGKVLKLFHDGVDEGIIHREYMIAQTIRATGLPVAEAFGLREVAGRLGIVYAELRGPTLLAYIRRHPHMWLWGLDQMARLQLRIQAMQVPLLRSRQALLIEDIDVAPISEALRVAAIDRLEQLVEGEALSHGDLHPANLIVTAQGLMVIDWSRAACAAPATDLVRSEMLMRFGPGQASHWWEAPVRDMASGFYMWRYRRLSGMDKAALAAWRPLVALAWLRQRLPGRDVAFRAYIEEALATAGLPPLGDEMSLVAPG